MVGSSAPNARITAVQSALAGAQLSALICRLPENVVLLSGYWPVLARSAVMIPVTGDPILIAPMMELEALSRTFIGDVRTFPVWKLGDPPPNEGLGRMLREAAAALGLRGARVGVEGSPDEDLAPTQKLVEPWHPAGPSRTILEALGAEVEDASPLLTQLRARKTAGELQRLRVANEIAAFGLHAFAAGVAEGRTEAEVAADVERAILAQGTGYKGTVHARAQALVFSGTERLNRVSWGYAPSTARRLARGDLVMVELCTVADGYYSDLTRMATVGTPSNRQAELLQAVAVAQRAAIAAVRPGVNGDAVDRAARDALQARGLADHFIHITGHGLGFRYHEGIPLLYPGATDVLAEGMVTSIEPGIYGPEFGGIRIEDNVAVTSSGSEVLSG
ncbi:MAG TPA: Xaa-Pro peptidase family protein [bacterium]|jgi:Xaa-Pro aminopeptidase